MDFLTSMDVVILALGSLLCGMSILVKGGDWTIDGAVEIARHYGMPPLLVGFTIVAFGTSLPELIASINANISGVPALAVGNVVGSNVANLFLIGGVCAFIMPLAAPLKNLRNDMIMMVLATVIWAVLLGYGAITPLIGGIALAALLGYIAIQYQCTKHNQQAVAAVMEAEHEAEDHAPKSHKMALTMVLGGLIGLAVGAELLIRGAVTIARVAHIPDSVIGLTIVAIGTSLPELTTCAVAAFKKHGDMILGNLIGSNVFNLMMILGSMGLVHAYDVSKDDANLVVQDLPIMLGVTLVFVAIAVVFKKIPQWAGVLFILAYVAYMILLGMQTL